MKFSYVFCVFFEVFMCFFGGICCLFWGLVPFLGFLSGVIFI